MYRSIPTRDQMMIAIASTFAQSRCTFVLEIAITDAVWTRASWCDGAERFMDELATAIADCPSEPDSPQRLMYQRVVESLPGDEAISFTTTGIYEPIPGTTVAGPLQVLRPQRRGGVGQRLVGRHHLLDADLTGQHPDPGHMLGRDPAVGRRGGQPG